MKKILLTLALSVALLTGTTKKAEAGIGVGIAGAVGSVYTTMLGVLFGSKPFINASAAVLTTGIVVGVGMVVGGSVLIAKKPNTGGIIGGVVLILLNDDSIENFEKLVDARYPFIENTEARKALAYEIKLAHENASIVEDGVSYVGLDATFLNAFSDAFNLNESDRSVLLSDLAL